MFPVTVAAIAGNQFELLLGLNSLLSILYLFGEFNLSDGDDFDFVATCAFFWCVLDILPGGLNADTFFGKDPTVFGGDLEVSKSAFSMNAISSSAAGGQQNKC